MSVSHRTVDRELEGRLLSEGTVLRYRMTTEIALVDSTLRASFVVDTVTDATASNILPSEIASATGKTFSARLARDGRLDPLEGGAASSPLVERLSNQLQEFFPRIPQNGIHAGLIWVDTTEALREQGGARLAIPGVTRYAAGAWEEREGTQELSVDWEREYRVRGTGEQFGQQFTIDGSGTTSGTSYFSANGRYLGSIKRDELSSEILIGPMGATIRLRQTQSDTVRTLPR